MSFIEDYLHYTENNESPAIYHRWAMLATLAKLCGRRFWFNFDRFTYYPNFYVLLVGDPGVKKNTAMDPSHDLLREVNKELKGVIATAATATTKEAICATMSAEKFPGKRFFNNMSLGGRKEEYNQLAIYAGEFTTFLGVNPEGMVAFLTDVFSSSIFEENYKNSGETRIVGPFITLLGCLTPSTMKGYLTKSIITSGLSRRTMFVWGNRGAPMARPRMDQSQKDAKARCVQWGVNIQNHSGGLTFDDAGWEWWEQWYNANYASIKDKKPSVQHYFGTKHEFMLKCGMLVTVANEGPQAKFVKPETLMWLEKFLFQPAEENLDRVFEGAGVNPDAEAASQVCRMLEYQKRPMRRKEVEAMFFASAMNIKDTIAFLISVGKLESRTVNYNGKLLGDVIAGEGVLKDFTDEQLSTLFIR